jgi:hypothetical protein
MVKSRRICLALGAALLVLAATGASALAAPVTVNLRVEGSSKTLFEGPVATEGATFAAKSSVGPHPCDYKDNGSAEGFPNGGNASGTPTTALRDAALASGLEFDAEWFGSGKTKTENPGDFFVNQVGSDLNESKAPFASWGYAVNNTTAPVGGCQIALAPGSEVLWAYNYFNLPHRLRLSGSPAANAGGAFLVHVTDGQSGEPISGASIGQVAGGVTSPLAPAAVTDAGGNASVTLSHSGSVTLKATRTESVRSNGLTVCVHNGNDGSCGTTVPTPVEQRLQAAPLLFEGDVAKISGVRNGRVYARRAAPRILTGEVEIRTGGTLTRVQISLERRYRGRCFEFSGSRVRFVRVHKCGVERFFPVGGTQSFSYLLPAPLPPGRYLFQMQAVESSGKRSKLVDGVSRVAFRVR